jgi:arylsulfatase A-like enzyme
VLRTARALVILLVLAHIPGALSSTPLRDGTASTERPPSVLVLLTDDQRWDSLWSMPTVRGRLAAHGVTFSNAYVTNPSCCPSRTSLLTGRTSPSTGVWSNSGDLGGFQAFDDDSTLATWLDEAGYRTGLFGKYLNGYDPASGYVPPGWDVWLGGADQYYYGYSFLDVRDGVSQVVTYDHEPTDYSTGVVTRRARSFLEATPEDEPFFAVVSYHAPHPPATPAPRDADASADVAPYRPPSFDEANVSDKPAWVRDLPNLSPGEEGDLDALRLDQLRSLMAVDRSVDRLLSTLGSLSRLRDTMVVFISDNGFQWGEHRWIGKGVPYEESIRVPMVVRFDPMVAERGRTNERFVLGIDLAPTVADLAGIVTPAVDGTSFVPLLLDGSAPFRESFVVEHRAEHPGRPSFCELRAGAFAFVRYYAAGTPGEVELYDLVADPFQLRNVADAARYTDARATLESEATAACVVPPP